jgi:hypothetical protein
MPPDPATLALALGPYVRAVRPGASFHSRKPPMDPQYCGRYFLDEREISEQQAASHWFDYAQEHDIDVARAISLWEDAATPEGEKSRGAVAAAGIRIEPPTAR